MEQKQIEGLSKLFNSDIIKSIYPMIDHIEMVIVKDVPVVNAYDLEINIFLNDPEIDIENMYRKGFDPHYLADNYLKKYPIYLGIKINRVGWKLYNSNGELMLNWSNYFF
jgi:hypothetical protein